MSSPTEPTLVTDPAALADHARHIAHEEVVALDTEFLRERTYFPKLCLIQIATGSGIVLVDPLAFESLSPLMEVLYAPQPLKVLHAAGQDLEVLVHLTDRAPPALFDTQVAAAHLGFPDQIGYAGLVEKVLGVALAKSHTRSDWSQRPLSSAQLGYAVDDVRHLRDLYPELRRRLEQAGRLEWALEDMERLEDPRRYLVDPDTVWRRVKGAGRLQGEALKALIHLARWREQHARRRDLPRRWVLSDEALMAVAAARPRSEAELCAMEGIGERLCRRAGGDILECLRAAAADTTPPPTDAAPLSDAERRRVKRLAARVAERARELDLSPALVAPRAELETIVRGGRDVPVLSGWRRSVVGADLLEMDKEN